jgi:Concanavalin A-like lectin/glucanases superfamily
MGTSYNPKIVTNGLVLNLDAGNRKSYSANQDTFVNNVSLMLDGESLTDKSQNSVAVTVEGSVIVDSSFKKVGNSSLKFGGALADGLTVPSSSLFAFPGDFTIEFWTYANQWGQRNGATVYFCNGVLNQFQLAVYPATQIELYFNGSSFINVPLSASIVGRWMHIALVRSGSTIRIYENGTSVGSGTSSYGVPASICYIGKQLPRSPTNYGHNLDGYIDDFRITKGARYTANFTPPTAPLSLPGVVTDLTKNRSIGTLVSGPTYSSGSIAFSGTSNYESINNILNVGPTSAFSVCTWAKWNTTATSGGARRPAVGISTITNSFEFALGFPYTYSSSKLGIEVGKAGVASQIGYSINSTPTGVWYHLAGVYKNGSCDFYLNGQYQSSITYSATINGSTTASGNWLIGTELFNGTTSSNTIGPMDGNVGQTLVYNRSITANEILQNFNATKGRFGL